MTTRFQYQQKAEPFPDLAPPVETIWLQPDAAVRLRPPRSRPQAAGAGLVLQPGLIVSPPPDLGGAADANASWRMRHSQQLRQAGHRVLPPWWTGVLEQTLLVPPPPTPGGNGNGGGGRGNGNPPPGRDRRDASRSPRAGLYAGSIGSEPSIGGWFASGFADPCPLTNNLVAFWPLDEEGPGAVGTCSRRGILVRANTLNHIPTQTPPQRKITRDSRGRIYVCYCRVHGVFTNVFIAWSDDSGASWTEERVSDDQARDQYWATIAIDSRDRLHVALTGLSEATVNDTFHNVFYRRRNADGSWEATRIVTDMPYLQHGVVIAVDQDDDLWLVWYGTGWWPAPEVTRLVMAVQFGGVWGEAFPITLDGAPNGTEHHSLPEVDVGVDGRLYIAFLIYEHGVGDGLWTMYVTVNAKQPFFSFALQLPRLVVSAMEGPGSQGHSLVVDQTLRVHVAYTIPFGPGVGVYERTFRWVSGEIVASDHPPFDPGTYRTVPIATGIGVQESAACAIDLAGTLHVWWSGMGWGSTPLVQDLRYTFRGNITEDPPASGYDPSISFTGAATDQRRPAPMYARYPGPMRTIPGSGYMLIWSDSSGVIGDAHVRFTCAIAGSGDGTRLDCFGNHDLDDVGNVPAVPGMLGRAARFAAGSGQFLEAIEGQFGRFGDRSFTLAAALRPVTVSQTGGIAGRWDFAGDQEYLLLLDAPAGGKLVWKVAGQSLATPFALTAGKWYFAIAWHDAGQDEIGLELFADRQGQPLYSATAPLAGGPPQTSVTFKVGAATTGSVIHTFDGEVDNLAVYQRVLDAGQRLLLWNEGSLAACEALCALTPNFAPNWLQQASRPVVGTPPRQSSLTLGAEPADFPVQEVTLDQWFRPAEQPRQVPPELARQVWHVLAAEPGDFPPPDAILPDRWMFHSVQPGPRRIWIPAGGAVMPWERVVVPALDSFYRPLVQPSQPVRRPQFHLPAEVLESTLLVVPQMDWLRPPPVPLPRKGGRPAGHWTGQLEQSMQPPPPLAWYGQIVQPRRSVPALAGELSFTTFVSPQPLIPALPSCVIQSVLEINRQSRLCMGIERKVRSGLAINRQLSQCFRKC